MSIRIILYDLWSCNELLIFRMYGMYECIDTTVAVVQGQGSLEQDRNTTGKDTRKTYNLVCVCVFECVCLCGCDCV